MAPAGVNPSLSRKEVCFGTARQFLGMRDAESLPVRLAVAALTEVLKLAGVG